MKKQIVIHIGHFKTATSSIQNAFYKNRHNLYKQGILYPNTGRPSLLEKGPKYNHVLLSEAILHEENRATADWYSHKCSKDILFAKLITEIQQSKCDKIFISSESFIRLSEDKTLAAQITSIAERLKSFDVKILFYIRRQEELIQSWYLQLLRMGHPVERDFFLIENISPIFLFFDQVIKSWQEAFAKDNILVRLFEPQTLKSNKSILSSVLHSINWPFPEIKIRETNPHKNKSIVVPEIADFVSYCNKRLSKKSKLYMKAWLYYYANTSVANHKKNSLVPKNMLGEIQETCRYSNEWVRENFFPEKLSLFKEEESSKVYLPQMKEEEIKSLLDLSGVSSINNESFCFNSLKAYYIAMRGSYYRLKEE